MRKFTHPFEIPETIRARKKKKKLEIDMTYAEEDGAEETRRRETSGAF